MIKFKRVVVFLLLLVTIASSMPVKANTLGNASDKTVEMVISSKLQSLTRKKTGYLDDRGILYYLSSLNALAMWNDAANNNNRTTLSPDLLTPYKNSLDLAAKDFNNKYTVSSDSNKPFMSTSLDNSKTFSEFSNSDQLKKYANYMAGEIIGKSSAQATAMFKKLNGDMAGKSDTEKQTYLTENSQVIKALYTMIIRAGSEYKSIQSLVNINDSVPMYKRDITKLTNQLTDSNNADIVKFAEDLEEKDLLSRGSLALTEENNDLNRLLADFNNEQLVNQAYLAIFSCSSIYLPFSSKVGEDSFVKALTSLVGEDASGKSIVELYNRQKSKLKPLYLRSIDKDDKPSGSASRLTVAEFMKNIEDQSSGVLVSVTGKFRRSEDSDSFAYYTDTDEAVVQYNDNGEEVKKETKEDKTATSTPSKEDVAKGAKVEENLTGELLASETITDTSRMSRPVFEFSENTTKNSSMGRILMWNILKDYKTDDLESEYDKQLLYVNPFGDIVLQDLTVVIPAASNPCYLNSGVSYNPNTAAFMNSYPKIALNTEYFSASDRDKEKFIVAMGVKKVELTEDAKKRIVIGVNTDLLPFGEYNDLYDGLGMNKLGPTVKCETDATAYTISSNKETIEALEVGDSTMPLSMEMYDSSLDGVQTMKAMHYDFKFHLQSITSGIKEGNKVIIVPDSGRLLNYDVPSVLFPLENTDNPNYDKVCAFIVKEYFDDITMQNDGTRSVSNGRLNLKLVTETLQCMYQGEDNIALFTKNLYDEYTKLNEVNIVTKGLMLLDEKILSVLGGVSGVIGVKNAYQDGMFGTVLMFTRKFMPFILIVIALYFLISYIRKRCNIIFSTACIAGSLALTFIGLQVLPIYVPILLNGVISSFSNEVSYKSLFMRQEQYLNPYDTKATYDSSGNFSYSTSSVNLYRFSDDQIDEFAKRYNTTTENLKSGKAIVLDDNSGLFVEGDLIKINLDRLFNGLSITGNYENSSEGNVYKLKSTKKISNVVDYYTPYYAIVDSYIDKLNLMTKVYNVPNSQLYYGNSLYKDSFVNSAYINSDLFLNRGKFDSLEPSSAFGKANLEIINENFPDQNVDWLGLQSVVAGDYYKANLDGISQTLWFKTMVNNGYYDEEGNIINSDKLAKVIDHVNNTTQQFLIDNSGQLSYLSDENIVKVTCMYALIDFNICISDWDSVVYPQALNYEELTLEDVLLPVLTKDYDRYIAQQRNIVSYIASDFGIVGLMLFAVVAILAFLICWSMRLAIPILYFILIISIIIRLSLRNNKSVSSILWGFLQISGGVLFSYAAFCYLTSIAYKFNDSTFCLFFLLIVYSVIATIIFSILMSFATNLGDFSSIKVRSTLGDIGRKFNKLPGIKKVTQKAQNVYQNYKERHRNNKEVIEDTDPRKTFHYSEDIYNEKTLDDIMSSRHNYDSYESPDNKKKKKRVVYKKNKVSKDYEYEVSPSEDGDGSFDKFEL